MWGALAGTGVQSAGCTGGYGGYRVRGALVVTGLQCGGGTGGYRGTARGAPPGVGGFRRGVGAALAFWGHVSGGGAGDPGARSGGRCRRWRGAVPAVSGPGRGAVPGPLRRRSGGGAGRSGPGEVRAAVPPPPPRCGRGSAPLRPAAQGAGPVPGLPPGPGPQSGAPPRRHGPLLGLPQPRPGALQLRPLPRASQ